MLLWKIVGQPGLYSAKQAAEIGRRMPEFQMTATRWRIEDGVIFDADSPAGVMMDEELTCAIFGDVVRQGPKSGIVSNSATSASPWRAGQ